MSDILNTSINYLKYVGDVKANLLKKELNIHTFGDLIFHFPFRYVDKTKFHTVDQVNNENTYYQIKGKIGRMQLLGQKRGQRLTALLTDYTGSIELVWFKGIRWIKDYLKPGNEYIVFAKPNYFNGSYNFTHPEIEEPTEDTDYKTGILVPVYSSTEKLKNHFLDSKGIRKLSWQLMLKINNQIDEILPEDILQITKLCGREEAFKNIHFPDNQASLIKAQNRLIFEEFFFFNLKMLFAKSTREKYVRGFIFSKVGDYFNTFYKENLKFELTGAQKRVIKEMRVDMASGRQMNRLLQGDVGSGKTLVALMLMLIAADNGFQSCLMAPTEILAQQHQSTFEKFTQGLGIRVVLLTGSTKKKERTQIHKALLEGDIDFIIGTHALIEDTVQFKNLGFVVIDEQHRFGVAQRAKLWQKNTNPPHILIMTATPIPRTLAMTIYGDLDVSKIDELPPGRKKILTHHVTESSRMRVFGFIREQIKQGRQIYIVYPLIEESEALDLNFLMDGYESISRSFPLPEYAVSIVHGKMKQQDKDYEMTRFVKHETDIMVATTVIEVGVDVPNASVMIIENAERFGLSQLHQLRGRVGRGAEKSYCILITGEKVSEEGHKRIQAMLSTTDGFEIAEMDMELRGSGDLQGLKQSGIPDFKIADILKDEKILTYSKKIAEYVLKKDPLLQSLSNKKMLNYLNTKITDKGKWGRVG